MPWEFRSERLEASKIDCFGEWGKVLGDANWVSFSR
jgi:hypothetical protein